MAMAAWCGVSLVLAGIAAAQPGADSIGPDPETTWSAWDAAAPPQPLWQVQFKAQTWYTAPGGEVKLPGSPSGLDRTRLSDLNLDSPRLSPSGELILRRGPWRLTFAGSATEVEGGATMVETGRFGSLSFGPGDRLDSDLRQTVLEATAGYRLFEARRGTWGENGSLVVFGVDAFAGIAARDFRLETTGPAGSTGVDEWFGEPIAGADMEIDLWKQVSVDLKVDVGGAGGYDGKTIGSAGIEVGVGWRPWENVGLTVGYRLGVLGATKGDGDEGFEVRGSNAGLTFGVEVRF